MNATSILELVLSGFIMSFTCYYVWRKFLNLKYKILSFKFISIFVILGFLFFINYYFNNTYIKICSITFCYFLILRFALMKDSKRAAITAINTEFLFFVADLLFSITLLLILGNNVEYVVKKYFGSLLTNFIVCTIVIILSNLRIFKTIYNKILDMTTKVKTSNILFVIAILIISLNLGLSFVYYKVSSITILIINLSLTIIYSFIVYKFIEQKNRYLDISNKYSLSESSLKELQNNVNRLMTLNHENKNQLLTIRGMVANKDKDVLKNIDAIIDRKIKDDKELKIRTSVISNTMLGSLIYSKLLTMKEKNINYNLHIDKTLSKANIINLGDKTNVEIYVK